MQVRSVQSNRMRKGERVSCCEAARHKSARAVEEVRGFHTNYVCWGPH